MSDLKVVPTQRGDWRFTSSHIWLTDRWACCCGAAPAEFDKRHGEKVWMMDHLVASTYRGARAVKQVRLFGESQLTHNPGGKVRLRVPVGITSSAVFGGERQEYRYRLRRTWDVAKPGVMFVMMNPSVASPEIDDPTVAKCRRYAMAWGFGTLLVGNTFAYRATDKRELLRVADPIGPENDAHLLEMAREANLVVLAYGTPHKRLKGRGTAVMAMITQQAGKRPHVLKISADGVPVHPLYLRSDLTTFPLASM